MYLLTYQGHKNNTDQTGTSHGVLQGVVIYIF